MQDEVAALALQGDTMRENVSSALTAPTASPGMENSFAASWGAELPTWEVLVACAVAAHAATIRHPIAFFPIFSRVTNRLSNCGIVPFGYNRVAVVSFFELPARCVPFP